ncbi:hypothetical protein ACKWNS_29825, partial [Escherichia coli]|uniref:hypothetical protein n=1 Tax=Escherichia coli TaxID=562 RepID=UPI0039046460
LSSGEYLPGSLQGKISSDGCLKKEQMVVSAIASTPQSSAQTFFTVHLYGFICCNLLRLKGYVYESDHECWIIYLTYQGIRNR